MKCFYHSKDFDGQCSGAIVKHFNPECELIGFNYGDEFPWDTIKPNEAIYMVDVSLPIDQMVRLSKMNPLIWIDHHIGVIREFNALSEDDRMYFAGSLSTAKAACELCWEYISRDLVPYAVEQLGIYDSWRFTPDTERDVKSFQYGLRTIPCTKPELSMPMWENLFNGNVDGIASTGRTIYGYQTSQNERVCNAGAFETYLVAPDASTLKCIALNSAQVGSDMFKEAWSEDLYDAMLVFYWSNQGQWNCSLYSTKVDCSVWAKKMGGSGHKGAAGFRCEELPFKLGEK